MKLERNIFSSPKENRTDVFGIHILAKEIEGKEKKRPSEIQ